MTVVHTLRPVATNKSTEIMFKEGENAGLTNCSFLNESSFVNPTLKLKRKSKYRNCFGYKGVQGFKSGTIHVEQVKCSIDR